MQELKDYSITHGGNFEYFHPDLKIKTIGQSVTRYMRFLDRVQVSKLLLSRKISGRWTPEVPVHPARIAISVLNKRNHSWKKIKDIELPYDPKIAGENLSPEMPLKDMDKHFKDIQNEPSIEIDLGGIETDHLRIDCQKEYPVWPSHGECNGGEQNVPFGSLASIKALGKVVESKFQEPEYVNILTKGKIIPSETKDIKIQYNENEIIFQTKNLCIGFSLIRPLITSFDWDYYGKGKFTNRLLNNEIMVNCTHEIGGIGGPIIRTIDKDIDYQQWQGKVEVIGNKVIYSNLNNPSIPVKIKAEFIIKRDKVLLNLEINSDKDIPVIEAECWRLTWDLKKSMTGVSAIPNIQNGRNGKASLPAIIASLDSGCLSVNSKSKNKKDCIQVESYRPNTCLTTGFLLPEKNNSKNSALIFQKGTNKISYELTVVNVKPKGITSKESYKKNITKHWSGAFTCFRPEGTGFSNNSISVNALCNLSYLIDLIVNTEDNKNLPNPIELAKYTIERAILDGPGYAYHKSLYLDTDPNMICYVGKIYQTKPDLNWLNKLEPGLTASTNRILNNIDNSGLVICKNLSGNTGSKRWSSNAMDVVGFGHIDAYVNAYSYRALRNSASLFRILGKKQSSVECLQAADKLKSAYPENLINPDTGWVAGWRSRDGELHDYGFIWINGPACAFGLLSDEQARTALNNLEIYRQKTGYPSAKYGLPCNLLPIKTEDHMLPSIISPFRPTFENYTNGGLSSLFATFYLRALSIYGFKKEAKKLTSDLEWGFKNNQFTGPVGSGKEFKNWSGIPNGYEGTLSSCLGPIYSIAVEKAFIKPSNPEWWLI